MKWAEEGIYAKIMRASMMYESVMIPYASKTPSKKFPELVSSNQTRR
jgi:hypothetical protein